MKKFYITYKDGTNIEGELYCSKKEFIIKLINPNIDDIYTYQIWDVEEEVVNEPRVIGKITLPDAPVKHKCVCDDCGDVLNDSCGDPRHKVSTYSDKYAVNPTAVRWICDICADEQFGDHSSSSIFSDTPDWMRYCY